MEGLCDVPIVVTHPIFKIALLLRSQERNGEGKDDRGGYPNHPENDHHPNEDILGIPIPAEGEPPSLLLFRGGFVVQVSSSEPFIVKLARIGVLGGCHGRRRALVYFASNLFKANGLDFASSSLYRRS